MADRDTPILIIDDEPSVIEGLTEFLDDEGFEVHQALEGKSGLDVFRQVNPHLVMTDLRMSGMSGIELIGEIRKINAHTPIIVVTGYGTLESAIDAIRLDVFDFITKPIDLNSLKSTLDRARSSLQSAREVQNEMLDLRNQLQEFQEQWKEQLKKFSEVEPLIHTGRLVAGILHNLNNPLTYIMGQAELLQLTHPEVENLGSIKNQAVRMKRIMTTIMKRVKESQTRQSEWLQFNEILQEEVFFLESHPYFNADIKKDWQLAPDLPEFKGIAADFSQIFGNILRNAAEAMKDAPVKEVLLKTWHDSSGIHLIIQDTGPGIPKPLQEKVFQPFFSTKSTSMGAVGSMGMGIGLYHCKELIRQYGGWIELESEPGQGARFIIHLPLHLCKSSSDD
ncbi:sensor histidine kinase [Desulforhabdus amnigena]|uniref:histidine kinase n=1 Tax=Desulforhabdus amnigena TaxID=40218 RepID=A0A9W6CZJ4_9BACT|nr:hybrid sensor histidine kinase/response regulator [Desulforhabdus amnigena]NLJ26423.1 hybrid sensor histidine kinase/response regulator [Deltaproteobacteria bacterium]GLI33187.1 hypothetical protein DAMNIGENAA_06200 [Desulforhabdus amnigena]